MALPCIHHLGANFNYFWQTNSVIKNNIVSYKIKTFFLLQLIYF